MINNALKNFKEYHVTLQKMTCTTKFRFIFFIFICGFEFSDLKENLFQGYDPTFTISFFSSIYLTIFFISKKKKKDFKIGTIIYR